jgi:peroxiredoxin
MTKKETVMARLGNKILDTGDKFPSLKMKTLDGFEIETPGGFKNPWNVILFYRGFWCPFCKAQLKSF